MSSLVSSSAPPPEYEKSVSESHRRCSTRENENQHEGNQKKAGAIQEITVNSNSSDLSDPPHHHDHKATQWSSTSGEQADDEDSGPTASIKFSSSDEESQTSQHQLKHVEQMSPKFSVSRSASSSGRSSEEKPFVVCYQRTRTLLWQSMMGLLFCLVVLVPAFEEDLHRDVEQCPLFGVPWSSR
jgi:hypothetical protein